MAAALWVPLCASFAFAQSSVPKPIGIKMGEGRLHPFLDVDTRFDSMIGVFDAAGTPVPEFVWHFRPGLKFDLETPSTLVAFNGAAEYLLVSGLLYPGSTALSRFQANVGLDAQFNKDGAVEFQIGDNLIRSDRTQNAAVGVGVISLFNDVRLAVPIHPGGRALEFTPKVSAQVEFFEPLLTGNVPGCTPGNSTCDPTLIGNMNYWNLQGGLTGRWKFLPKTAVVLDTQFDYRNYFVTAGNLNAMLLRAQLGLIGLVSPKISVTLMAGYAGDFASSGVQTVIGHAELAYLPSEGSRVALGYLRTVQPVPIYGTYGDDRGYLQTRLAILGGRLNLLAGIQADYFSFYGASGRNDLLLSGNAGLEFDVTSWFGIGAGYTLGLRSPFGNAPASLNYVRHEALLRLTLRY